MAGSFSTLRTPYTALNLWVYGDGSGNQLSFLYTGDIKSDLELPVTTPGLHRLEADQRAAAPGTSL